jgi:thiol-disulfide isomerase/thioredoxin
MLALLFILVLDASAGEPQMVKYDHKDRRAFLSSKLENHMLLFLSGGDGDSALMEQLRAAAAINEQHVLHVYVPKDQDIPRKFFGLELEDLPACFLYKNAHDIKYRLEEADLTTEALLRFTEEVLEGKTQPYLRSEQVPVAATGPVVKLVGKTFSASISDPELDWIVLFHAPDCPYTVELMPIFTGLAESNASPKLRFATLDYTANEVQWTNFRLDHSPTLYLFQRPDKGTPLSFEDPSKQQHSRDGAGITAFLEENRPVSTAQAVKGEL